MVFNFTLGRILKKAEDTSSKKQQSEEEIKEKDGKKCSHRFGYLVKHPKDTPFPEECLICSRILECLAAK